MEIDEVNEIIIREALQRLGPRAPLDLALLQEQIAKVINERGEKLLSKLSDRARAQLRRDGLRMGEQFARLKRIDDAIEFGRSLIAKYKVKTLGELPQDEQQEFGRLWTNSTDGGKFQEN